MSKEQTTTTASTKRAKTVTGIVISDKMDKSIVVLLQTKVKHPLYGKYVTRKTKLHAHDEKNECREGDLVTIHYSRPISKKKHWRLVKVVRRQSDSDIA